MKEKILKMINELKIKNVSDVKGMILVTKDWREVFFFAKVNGVWHKSYDMIEDDMIDSVQLDEFEKKAAELALSSPEFKEGVINVVEFGTDGSFLYGHEDLELSTYKLTKRWKLKNGI